MKIRDDAISFRIYPEKDRKVFYIAYIFRSKRAMYQHFNTVPEQVEWRKGSQGNRDNDFDAITHSWDATDYSGRRGRPKRARNIGQILFYVGSVDAGVVSHEMTHAALHFLERRRVNAANLYQCGVQERCCWIQGHLVTQFWRRFFTVQSKVGWLK